MTPTDTTQIRNMARIAKERLAPPPPHPYYIHMRDPTAASIDNLADAVEMLCNLIDQKDAKFRPQGAP